MYRPLFNIYNKVCSILVKLGFNKYLNPGVKRFGDNIFSRLNRWTRLQSPNYIFLRNMKLNFPIDGYFVNEMATGVYEAWTTKVFKRQLKPGMIVVDVGAHVGYYTILASQTIGEKGRVFSFEPDPFTFSYLEKNVVTNQLTNQVVTTQAAVGDVNGTTQLFLGRRDRLTNSIFSNNGVKSETIPCSLLTIDTFLEGQGVYSIDFIKIDVEGAEGAVLAGMQATSERSPYLKAIIEFMPDNLKFASCPPEIFFTLLKDLGFNKISMIFSTLEPVKIPDDIEMIVRRVGAGGFINLLCEKV